MNDHTPTEGDEPTLTDLAILAAQVVHDRMRLYGYTDEQIAAAAASPPHTSNCEHLGWGRFDCHDEAGGSHHADRDEYEQTAEWVMWVIEHLTLADRARPAPAATHVVHATSQSLAEDVVWCDECEEWVMSGAPAATPTDTAGQGGAQCGSCGVPGADEDDCAESRRLCGHHSGHSRCDWCGQRVVSDADQAPDVAAQAGVRALRDAADALPAQTEGERREGTTRWREELRAVYSLAVEECQAALRAAADRLAAEPPVTGQRTLLTEPHDGHGPDERCPGCPHVTGQRAERSDGRG